MNAVIEEAMKTVAIHAPEFDEDGYYGNYHPNYPETKHFSIYAGLTTEERLVMVEHRRAMTEAPKCAAYFTDRATDCDLPISHICKSGDILYTGCRA